MIKYKVVPFTATLNQQQETIDVVAWQLENLITRFALLGWTYVRLEGVSTYVQPDTGCFGLGAKPGFLSSYQMVVFQKDEE